MGVAEDLLAILAARPVADTDGDEIRLEPGDVVEDGREARPAGACADP